MVQSVQLFQAASYQADWLSARQAALTSNIANVNTPGYRAVDVTSFEKVLKNDGANVSMTDPRHIPIGGTNASFGLHARAQAGQLPSGNSVSMEDELIRSNEVRQSFELNTAIVRSFHRMYMMTTR
jgi:flagellar basal-body rod protein FlgB